MKTMTIRDAKPQLGKLAEQVQRGAPVILVQGDKPAKLERYEPLDPECDSPQLETMLLEAVRGPHAPYSRKELEAVLEKISYSIVSIARRFMLNA
jgi:antitoxin (DNA-binding transcriptional repressor) of toxin-antitoxin stability system